MCRTLSFQLFPFTAPQLSCSLIRSGQVGCGTFFCLKLWKSRVSVFCLPTPALIGLEARCHLVVLPVDCAASRPKSRFRVDLVSPRYGYPRVSPECGVSNARIHCILRDCSRTEYGAYIDGLHFVFTPSAAHWSSDPLLP
jgi:hypothetical protein